MAGGGPNCWGKGLQKGARGWGQEGLGKGGGVRGGVRGWGEALIEVFVQNRYRIIQFSYRHAHYETKSAEIAIFEGVSPILAGNPRVMTSRSRKYVIISPENEMCERFHDGIAPPHEEEGQPSWLSLKDFKCILFNNGWASCLDITDRDSY